MLSVFSYSLLKGQTYNFKLILGLCKDHKVACAGSIHHGYMSILLTDNNLKLVPRYHLPKLIINTINLGMGWGRVGCLFIATGSRI